MTRAVVLILAASIAGTGLASEAGAARKKCPKGSKLVGKKCKKIKRPTVKTDLSVKAVAGSSGGASFSITPNAKAKTALVKVKITCQSAEGQPISQSNGAGTTVKASAVINLQQKFDGSVSDSAAGTALSWQLTGTWKTATRFEGIFSGTATQPGADGFSAGCNVAPVNVVLR